MQEKGHEKIPLDDASVYLDGKLMGTTGKTGKLVMQEIITDYNTLEVKKSGFFTYKENVQNAEYTESKVVTLYSNITTTSAGYEDSSSSTDDNNEGNTADKSKQGKTVLKILVQEDSGAEKLPLKGVRVFLNGQQCGETDDKGFLKKSENPGKYTLKIEKDGFSPIVTDIELTEYSQRLEIVLEKLPSQKKVAEQPADTPKEGKTQDGKAHNAAKKSTDKQNGFHSAAEKITLEIRVLGDNGTERIPIKYARILIDGYLCGETDKEGILKKIETMDRHTIRVEKKGFYPVIKEINCAYSTSAEIVLKKEGKK